jgi:ABC-type cobalamin transport system permease subunit
MYLDLHVASSLSNLAFVACVAIGVRILTDFLITIYRQKKHKKLLLLSKQSTQTR